MARLFRLSMIAFLVTMLVVVSFGSGFGIGRYSPASVPNLPASLPLPLPIAGASDSQRLVAEAWRILERDFVDRRSIDEQKMAEAAIRAMIESLGDRNMGFATREQFQANRASSRGSYSGIGATVNKDDGRLIIVSPIAGSPAEEAGLIAGTWIQAVNGADIANLTLNEAVELIRGPTGTRVRLTVLIPGQSAPRDVEITRAEVRTASVTGRMLENGVAYIDINQVTQRTGEELRAIIRDLRAQNPRSVVLDLRGNPGGDLNNTVQVLSQFLREGVVLVEVDADGNRRTLSVQSGGQMTDLPMVVLVDRGSASAAEVISGALQDQRRAIVIGERTFGKGTINIWRELSNGSALYVSIARWYTPNGRLIEREGIQPDIVTPLTPEDIQTGNDAQLRRAVEYLLNGR